MTAEAVTGVVERPDGACCGGCRWFERGAAAIERAIPGLSSLSSGHGASRADDGWCVRRDRLLRVTACCGTWDAEAG